MLKTEDLHRIVELGIEIANEKNHNRLLQKLLTGAMEIADCDAGTVYLFTDEKLKFMVMKTLSQGVSQGENGEETSLPPVPLREENVCAYSAIHRELINIPDVYTSDRFDFSGPRKYDSMTGYRTRSMLVIPLEDSESQLVGVLQLMNKENGAEGVSFTDDDIFVIRSIGAIAAISLSEKIYLSEVKEQMHSFVQAFATAVDERTPYNGSHTRKVTEYSGILADYINELHEKGETEDFFNENRKEQLLLAATLHDIGKMIVPLSVMNKATRLDTNLQKVIDRFELLSVMYERDMLRGKYSEEEFEKINTYLTESIEFIKEIDNAGFMPDEKLLRVKDISEHYYEKENGEKLFYLTDAETECLMIRKGTLTDKEREIMESHVVMTKKILDQVHFNKRYSNVTRFAATHHEKLNGKGYPNKLSADELELESRMLAVCDVYDALTSTDRPYKKPMPKEKAFAILYDMAKYEEVEERLVKYLEEALERE